MTITYPGVTEAIAKATAGYTEVGENDEGASIRIRHLVPGKKYADTSWIGRWSLDDAPEIAARLRAELAGWMYDETPYSYVVAHITDKEVLSTRKVSERSGLADSTIRTYRSKGLMPEPDVTIGGIPGWYASTIDPWIAALPGRGARTDLR